MYPYPKTLNSVLLFVALNVSWDAMGIMEKKMETTILGLYIPC